MKIAAVYARYTSTHLCPTSIDDQISSCEQYAKMHNMIIDQRYIYSDATVSCSLAERKGLANMMKDAKENKFEVALVDDLSRLPRKVTEMLTVIQQLGSMGIALHSVMENVDTSDEKSEFMSMFKGIMNEASIDDLGYKLSVG